jgi:hypothetical protein
VVHDGVDEGNESLLLIFGLACDFRRLFSWCCPGIPCQEEGVNKTTWGSILSFMSDSSAM